MTACVTSSHGGSIILELADRSSRSRSVFNGPRGVSARAKQGHPSSPDTSTRQVKDISLVSDTRGQDAEGTRHTKNHMLAPRAVAAKR